jgi:hypothetical protein
VITSINTSILSIVNELDKLTLGKQYTVKTIAYDENGDIRRDSNKEPILVDLVIDGFFSVVKPFASSMSGVIGMENENGVGAGVIYKGGSSETTGIHSFTINTFDPARPKERTEKEYDTRFSYKHNARFSIMAFIANPAPQEQKLTDYNGYSVLEMLDIIRLVISGMKPCPRSTPLKWIGNAPASMSSSQNAMRGGVWYEISFQCDIFINDGLQLQPSYVTGCVPTFYLKQMQDLVHDLKTGQNVTVGTSVEEEILGGVK